MHRKFQFERNNVFLASVPSLFATNGIAYDWKKEAWLRKTRLKSWRNVGRTLIHGCRSYAFLLWMLLQHKVLELFLRILRCLSMESNPWFWDLFRQDLKLTGGKQLLSTFIVFIIYGHHLYWLRWERIKSAGGKGVWTSVSQRKKI